MGPVPEFFSMYISTSRLKSEYQPMPEPRLTHAASERHTHPAFTRMIAPARQSGPRLQDWDGIAPCAAWRYLWWTSPD